MLFQRFKNHKNLVRQIDEVQVEFIVISNSTTKNYYIASTSKMSIRMKSETRYTVLINTDVEINVMTEDMMFKKKLVMRSRLYINFVSHIDHTKNFLRVCENVKMNINEFRSRHHIFVMNEANHVLVLDQSFMKKNKISTQWRFDDIYMIVHDKEIERQTVFRILSNQNKFSLREENEIFSFKIDHLN